MNSPTSRNAFKRILSNAADKLSEALDRSFLPRDKQAEISRLFATRIKRFKFRHPNLWKLLLLGFIGLGVGILRRPLGYVGQVGIGIEYYSHTSIPTCSSVASERRGIPIVRRGGTPSKANPTYSFSI